MNDRTGYQTRGKINLRFKSWVVTLSLDHGISPSHNYGLVFHERGDMRTWWFVFSFAHIVWQLTINIWNETREVIKRMRGKNER